MSASLNRTFKVLVLAIDGAFFAFNEMKPFLNVKDARASCLSFDKSDKDYLIVGHEDRSVSIADMQPHQY